MGGSDNYSYFATFKNDFFANVYYTQTRTYIAGLCIEIINLLSTNSIN